ncbi:hypothetical protein M0R45_031949 [Rubus argutus]|uniref:Reverse transcriptase domain-containing protein n=1 Tax=Rubus argutus TaxID=59490 RepID=A0AAW1WJP2_RUBAR
MRVEVDKLLSIGFIREVQYPRWLANPVLVKKPNGKWRMCIDFTDLNKACPKDSFPLPRIEQLVNSTAGHEALSFMDAYSGYNQIKLDPDDQEHTSFMTDQGLYCYNVLPFGLKNAGATYQRLVNRMFSKQIWRTMEVYVDDMLIKSLKQKNHLTDLQETFTVLQEYGMKLNPEECVFCVGEGKFLGFMVSHRGIEANPEKIQAILDLQSPRTFKEFQSLNGRITALSRFISRSTDRCALFFKILKTGKKFEGWTTECETTFTALKEYLASPPLLSRPTVGEPLFLYLSVSKTAVSSILVRNHNKEDLPVDYTSKSLQDTESRYPEIEQLTLALMVSARRLRTSFQSHPIVVLTDYPLRLILQRPETSGRLTKWSIELSEFDITYRPRPSIKAQVLADFVSEFTPHRDTPATTGNTAITGRCLSSRFDTASELQHAGMEIERRRSIEYTWKRGWNHPGHPSTPTVPTHPG